MKPWNNNATFCRNWHAKQKAAGLIALKETEFQNLQGAIKALLAHEDSGPILRAKGESELSLGCMTTHGPVRMRYDWVPEGQDLVDLKFTADASERWWTRHAWDMGYHIQCGLGLWLWNQLCGSDQPKTGFLFIVVENTPPYAVNVFRASPEFIRLGTEAFMKHLATFHECNTTGIWPAFTTGIKQLEPPNWAL